VSKTASQLIGRTRKSTHDILREARIERGMLADRDRGKRRYWIYRVLKFINDHYSFEFTLYRGNTPWPRKKVMLVVEMFKENKKFRNDFIKRGCEGELWAWRFSIEDSKKYREAVKAVKMNGGCRPEDSGIYTRILGDVPKKQKD